MRAQFLACLGFASSWSNLYSDTTSNSLANYHLGIPNALRINAPLPDPIKVRQVLDIAEQKFPNLASELGSTDILQRAVADPSMRGSLRGRLAEEVFQAKHGKDGWRPVKNPNAPQNDFYRFVGGKLEGAQIKVHANVGNYVLSMLTDNKAEVFVVPDDHYELIKKDLEIRRQVALRSGLVEKAAGYAREKSRLTKLGRTFTELDEGIVNASRYHRSISVALRQAGRAASFIAISLSLVEGSLAVYQFATGKDDALQFAQKIAKIGVAGAASWYAAGLASQVAIGAGASGMVPVAVAIVVGAVTYIAVDWAVDYTVASFSVAQLTDEEWRLIWRHLDVKWIKLNQTK